MQNESWTRDPQLTVIESNPHIAAQVCNNVYQNGRRKYTSRDDIPFTRILDQQKAPVARYRRRENEAKSVIHHGQRKLLLSEIEFFTTYAKDCLFSGFVVYVGAAEGRHIKQLLDMFRYLHFHLYDTTKFDESLYEENRVLIYNRYFTDDDAKLWCDIKNETNVNVFFISDIRTANPGNGQGKDNPQQVEIKVADDMNNQMNWHILMKPTKSLLKFRLPWKKPDDNPHTKYLDGDVYLPVWGPQTTSEARLVPNGDTTKWWDSQKYEGQMFHFNTVTRIARYNHDMPVGHHAGFHDYCYDCTAEYNILQNYLNVVSQNFSIDQLLTLCANCSTACGRTLERNIPMIFDDE